MQTTEAGAAPREVLAIALGGEEYGIDIGRVQEIRGYDAVTRLANAPGILVVITRLMTAHQLVAVDAIAA